MALKLTDPKAMDTLNAIQALLLTQDGGFAVAAQDEKTIGWLTTKLCEVAWEDDPRRMKSMRDGIFELTGSLDLIDHRVQDTVTELVTAYLADYLTD